MRDVYVKLFHDIFIILTIHTLHYSDDKSDF